MTREEAIAILQKIKPIPYRGDSKSTTHILETIALEMAIKALEQEPCVTMRDLSEEELKHFAEEMKKVRPQVVERESILDKIRAEIINPNEMDKLENSNLWQKWFLNLIDKYKAESEG